MDRSEVPERRPIPGWEGLYEVDTDGNVYSLPRIIAHKNGHKRRVAARVLRQQVRRNGYLHVILCRRASEYAERVHTLVALAFFGPKPDNMVVCHNDGDKTNNRLSNLRYATMRENSADSVRHGTWAHGEGIGNHILTAEEVKEIRRLRAEGWAYKDLGEKYGVHPHTASRAARGIDWKHVPFEVAP